MKKLNLIEKRAITFLLFSVLLLGIVGAYNIASPVWKGHPLYIAPGDTKTVSITLQNMDEEDETVQITLKKGSEIASLREGEYLVPAKTKDTEILVTITMPEDVRFDTVYEVTLGSTKAVSTSPGGVTLGLAMDTTFDVLAADVLVSEPEKTNTTTIIIAVAIAIVLALIIILGKKKSRKSK